MFLPWLKLETNKMNRRIRSLLKGGVLLIELRLERLHLLRVTRPLQWCFDDDDDDDDEPPLGNQGHREVA